MNIKSFNILEKKKCPLCTKEYLRFTVGDFCPNCGTNFTATHKICAKCEAANDFAYKYCTFCGAKFK